MLGSAAREMATIDDEAFAADAAAEVLALRRLLRATGLTGVHLEVRRLSVAQQTRLWGRDASPLLGAFVAATGLARVPQPPRAWASLERARATRVLSDNLQWDQAYGVHRLERGLCAELATGFVDLFGELAVFFSNATFTLEAMDGGETRLRADGWFGLVTGATFEAGVVAADGERIGLFYVSDED